MRILIVDDQPANNEFLLRVLRDHKVVAFTDPVLAERHALTEPFDLLITDQKMPGLTGLELIRRIRIHKRDFVAVVLSAYTDPPDLVAAINDRTVFRYLVKPLDTVTIRDSVIAAEELLQRKRRQRDLERELAELNAELSRSHQGCTDDVRDPFLRFVGEHPAVRKLLTLARSYAATEEAVLITGETGTGKEILARALHDASPRREGPFVALNCSAFSEHLIESELFGHRKGAYTDARDGKKGLVEIADGGTLFLDEIGDFPGSLQPKILRFIQDGTFLPVGSTREHQVNVRIVSATNRDLRNAVETGQFRQDLYYRINTLELTIPPVRDRASDIPLLLERVASLRGYRLPHLSDGIIRMIQAYPFPGNVREIEALAARISVYSSLGVEDGELAGLVRDFTDSGAIATLDGSAEVGLSPLEAAEIEVLRQTLNGTGGNLTRAAELLALSRQGLRDKLKRYGLYESTRSYR